MANTVNIYRRKITAKPLKELQPQKVQLYERNNV